MCIFCKFVTGEIPANKIYEDQNTLAFLDMANDCYGHTLVIPKLHCENVFDASEEVLAACMATVKKVAKHYETLGFEGINIINNSGRCSGQSVFHIHFHIFPRKSDKPGVFEKYYPQNIVRNLEEEQKLFKVHD